LTAASGSREAVGIIGMVNNASGNSGSLTFHTYDGGADIPERLRLDNKGNMGLGVTPESWNTAHTALDIGITGALMSHGSANVFYTMCNAYLSQSSGWLYKYTDTTGASLLSLKQGGFIFDVAAGESTADSAISWTTAMTIANDGNIAVSGTVDGRDIADDSIKAAIATPINRNIGLWGGLDGYGGTGVVSVTRVSPATKGFEGHYWSPTTRSNFAASTGFAATQETATSTNPYDYGSYNKGPRNSRGGLLDGWGGSGGGGLLRLYKASSGDSYANALYIAGSHSYAHGRTRIRGYFWVQTGSLTLHLRHLDDGGAFSIPSLKTWHYIDTTVSGSDITSGNFYMSLTGVEEREVYIGHLSLEPCHSSGENFILRG
jgi:hypothetical protein